MTWYTIVIIVLAGLYFATLAVIIPLLKKKGVNGVDALNQTSNVLTVTDNMLDQVKEYFPEVPYINTIDKVLEYANKAVKVAEQKFKDGEITSDERKVEAISFLKSLLELSGLEINDKIYDVIGDIIEGEVFNLPKTNKEEVVSTDTEELVEG